MTILTFGKHKGRDINQLARTDQGRDYLMWCADNLKNCQWVRKIERALRRNNTPYMELQAEVLATGANLHQFNQVIQKWWADELDFQKHICEQKREAIKAAFAKYAVASTGDDDIDPDAWMTEAGHDKDW